MARQFGDYSPAVPLGMTWEESLAMVDENGVAIDLTGYDAQAQLREAVPAIDPATGNPKTDPVLELTTSGFYSTQPAWPVVAGLSMPTPTDGTILLSVDPSDTWMGSPDNSKRKLYWSVKLVNKTSGYAIPVVQGKVTFLPARTI